MILVFLGIVLVAFIIARVSFLKLRKRGLKYPLAAGVGIFVVVTVAISGALVLYALMTVNFGR